MPLDDIRLLSDLDESAPDGAVVSASELDDYIRQTRAFLKAFLSVAHDNTGALKEDLSNLTFADIGGQVESSQIAVRAIGPEHLVALHADDRAQLPVVVLQIRRLAAYVADRFGCARGHR